MDAVEARKKLQEVMRGQGSAAEHLKALAEVMTEMLDGPVVTNGAAPIPGMELADHVLSCEHSTHEEIGIAFATKESVDPGYVPSAADLDAVAEEQKAVEATAAPVLNIQSGAREENPQPAEPDVTTALDAAGPAPEEPVPAEEGEAK